jgi:DNA-binding NtrC family response regulator
VNVLIVEDEAIVALALKTELVRHGIACRVASSSAMASNALEADVPDVVFMDVHLGGSDDGVATARLLHRQYGVPICFMSGYSPRHVVRDDVGFEPIGFLEKPVTFSQITSILDGIETVS